MGNPQDPAAFEAATDAAAAQGSDPIDKICELCQGNWIKLRYEYEDGTGVSGANYVVHTVATDGPGTGVVLAEGTTDANGEAHDLAGKHLDTALGLPDEMMTRIVRLMTEAKGWFSSRWNQLIDEGLAKVAAVRSVATAKLREAAKYLQKQLFDTLRQGMSRTRRGGTKNAEPHVVKQEKIAPGGIVLLAARNMTEEKLDPVALCIGLAWALLGGVLVASYTTYDAWGIREAPNPLTFLA